ncbi:MAG: tetratricopeptide repeat protein [Acidobacteriaceae bacterium]|nr:tetratricopeptide repeat protein [Acidobacteriaceae bacterium]MBV9500122.1 tetratricopeptide repeat protein [Acidobacteriaceae bacterium]
MTRRTLLSACLFGVFSVVAPARQTPGSAQQTQQKPAQQQGEPSDESNPPEEDESVAPEKFVLNPLESDRNVRVGNFYMKQGSRGYHAALGRYERATKYNPRNAEAFFKIGEVEEKLRNQEAAKTAYRRVLEIAPDSKFAHEAKKRLGKG